MKYFIAIIKFMLMSPKSPAMSLLQEAKGLLDNVLKQYPPDCLFVTPLRAELEKFFDFIYPIDCDNNSQAEEFRHQLIRFAWQVSKYAMRRQLSDIKQEKLIIHMVHVVHQAPAVALIKRLRLYIHLVLSKYTVRLGLELIELCQFCIVVLKRSVEYMYTMKGNWFPTMINIRLG